MELDILSNRKTLKKNLLKDDSLIPKKIAILSGSTIGEIKNILELYLLYQGIKPDFWVGEYNRYYEDAVFDNDDLRNFGPELIYIHTTNKNIQSYPQIGSSVKNNSDILEYEYKKFEQIWTSLQKRYNCPIIQNNFDPLHYRIMGNADSYRLNGKQRFLNEINTKMYDYANKTDGFYINDINYLASYCGIVNWFDETKWYLYKYALNPEAMPLLCENISIIIKSLLGKNKKAIVLDLDNTLWGGVIGDDGLENILLGEESPQGRAFRDFQLYLKEISQLGILLNVCSKNEYEIALSGFKHKSSVLNPSDFIAFEANWNDKNTNIEKIAHQINLGFDNMIFIDDSPVEREIVKNAISGIEVPEMTVPEKYLEIINKKGYFEVTALSTDDLMRKEYYQSNKNRQGDSGKFLNYDDYLISLNMKAEIQKFKYENIERVTQLINKTNQFNFTTRRYTINEIEALLDDRNTITLQASLFDKYGDNGIVSALIVNIENNTATVELWVMSCRVFKRGLEFAVFDELVLQCIEMGVATIVGVYKPSAKNTIIKELYGELGFEKQRNVNPAEDIWVYKLNTEYIKKNKVIGVNKNG